VEKGPETTRRTRLARSMRLLGVWAATTLHGLISPPRA
jgi:hypothetical protein